MTEVYLPDPANDETLTMTGYEWWRYRAVIEAEAIARVLAQKRAPDFERLAIALHLASGCESWPAHGPHREHEETALAAIANWPNDPTSMELVPDD